MSDAVLPAGDATAAAAAAKPAAPAASRAASAGAWLRENLEAVAVAVVMALLIRHFCVEAFRIPTSSMEPTLYGSGTDRAGDRILVNKFRYHFVEPSRYDIVVFRYPMNRDRNYIKRIGGMPGEELDLRGGDVFADGKPARKPARAQAGLWRPMWDLAAEVRANAEGARLDGRLREAGVGTDERAGARALEGLGFREGTNTLRLEGGVIRADTRGQADVCWAGLPERNASGSAVDRDDSWNEVGDLRLRLRLRAQAGPQGAVWVAVGPPPARFRVRIPVGGGPVTCERRDGTEGEAWVAAGASAPQPPWGAGAEVTLAVAHADARVSVTRDGTEIFALAHDPKAEDWGGGEWSGLPRLGLQDVSVEIAALGIDRDTHYVRDTKGTFPFHVPAGHYVMLGDNSTHSKDSRSWQDVTFDVAPGIAVGDRIRGDGDPNARGDDGSTQYQRDDGRGILELVDETGFRWVLPRRDVLNFDAPRVTHAPFVPRDHIVGQAFFIFYPPRRLAFVR